MIPLIPYWKCTLDSPLTRQQVLAELATTYDFVSTDQRIHQPIQDITAPAEFQIERIIGYRNPFLPRIYGRIYPAETGSRIQIVMTLSPISWILMLGSVGWFAPLSKVIIDEIIHSDLFGKPAAIIAIACLVFILGFGIEALMARRLLEDLFQVD
ncbi:hypothetical protein [Spirosoma endophyticum]|uniref:Uncharacterized protein n=1 Tax=Spirosoma endophyticum TaxID=662367 RepID=A0A1I2GW15_9BACT|nr:hypothetical protein [Spirosoma endophyticum]SFF21632.1 hypothetical protein SAMN05216167_1362 [Spirosoma endophyticum]